MRKGKGKGYCKLNKVVLFPIDLVMLIVLALSVYSAPQLTINTATLQDNTDVNISTKSANDDSLVNFTYVTIRCSSPNTANSTTLNIINITNTTATNFDLGYANFTFGNSIILEDSNDYSCTAISTGSADGTADVDAVASSALTMTVDRTAPSIPTSASPTGTLTSRTQTISATVNGANTTSCTLRFIGKTPGFTTYTMTHSASTCEQAFTNIPETTYIYTISASDGTNTSITGENTMTIDIRTSTARKAYIASGGQLPTQAQQRAGGQQAANVLDRVIAKAPQEAQAGLTKAKESVTKQYKGFEAVKTWSGTVIGCGAGLFGLALGPLGLITIPAGCVGGHLIGAVV